MRRTLRILAVIVALGAAAFWAACGANSGWTKTSTPRTTLDEVTGIEGVTYEKKFVPGLDFLGAAGLGAALLAGVSVLIPRKKLEPENR
jgi:hypothetical protein